MVRVRVRVTEMREGRRRVEGRAGPMVRRTTSTTIGGGDGSPALSSAASAPPICSGDRDGKKPVR